MGVSARIEDDTMRRKAMFLQGIYQFTFYVALAYNQLETTFESNRLKGIIELSKCHASIHFWLSQAQQV